MISFLIQEGVITIGTISGIFTALLLNSVKNNIIDPVVEKIAPLDKIHNEEKFTTPPVLGGGVQIIGNQFGGKTKIKTNIFIRDLITWLILMLILYLLWKHVIQPIKNKNVPTNITQFIPPTRMGKK